MNSFMYEGDVKVAMGLADSAVMLYSENDNKVIQLHDAGWVLPAQSMATFNYKGDTKIVVGLGCKSSCGAVEMYSIGEEKWTQLHGNGWERPVNTLEFFEYNGISYIIAGLGAKDGAVGGAVELYNMESNQWSQLGTQWDSRVLKLDIIGEYLLAGQANGELSSFPLSKIAEGQYDQGNWDTLIIPSQSSIAAIMIQKLEISPNFFISRAVYIGLANGGIYRCDIEGLIRSSEEGVDAEQYISSVSDDNPLHETTTPDVKDEL